MTSARSGLESAAIMSDGLMITFDDGRRAIYPAELLLAIFSQAREIEADDDDDALPSWRPPRE
jgi:hypothetical protein